MRPVLLDLFCGCGGAAMGYHRAGFDVIGVDNQPQPRYPFTFFQMDWEEGLERFAQTVDVIHASPPCQHYSPLGKQHGKDYPDLVQPVRDALRAAGLPYVIENVPGAPLLDPITLCGSMFSLGSRGRELRRHRLFESNLPLKAPQCTHRFPVVGVYGNGGNTSRQRGYAANKAEGQESMGIYWALHREVVQAIPPAYTEHIGSQLLGAGYD